MNRKKIKPCPSTELWRRRSQQGSIEYLIHEQLAVVEWIHSLIPWGGLRSLFGSCVPTTVSLLCLFANVGCRYVWEEFPLLLAERERGLESLIWMQLSWRTCAHKKLTSYTLAMTHVSLTMQVNLEWVQLKYTVNMSASLCYLTKNVLDAVEKERTSDLFQHLFSLIQYEHEILNVRTDKLYCFSERTHFFSLCFHST